MSPPTISKTNKTKNKRDPNIPKENYLNINGVAGNVIGEKDYKFYKLENENVIQKANSFIVLGRDRPSTPLSGYGGKGETKSNSIDIVVGRTSCVSDEADLETQAKWSNPDFKNDAARIHISQKTDIDKNFALPAGKVGFSTEKGLYGSHIVRSGIGIKADSVRMIARSGIKLVSSCDTVTSMGITDQEKKGIDLIAGVPYDPVNEKVNQVYNLNMYKHGMQPIPKGDNLRDALFDVVEQLDKVTGMLLQYISQQMSFNMQISTHTHFTAFNGSPSTNSPEMPGFTFKTNAETYEISVKDIKNYKFEHLPFFIQEYLTIGQRKYINSVFHHLN